MQKNVKTGRQPENKDAFSTAIVLLNRQRAIPVRHDWRSLLRAVVAGCVKASGFPYPAEVHVSLVGVRTIRRMNREYRNRDAVTDVLSFPALAFRTGKPVLEPGDIDPQTGLCFLGDVAVCLPRMREQAAEYGHGETRELAFLAAHGTLHLLGYDHETSEDESVMFDLQESMLVDMGFPRREAMPC